jgi:hypothetical protein
VKRPVDALALHEHSLALNSTRLRHEIGRAAAPSSPCAAREIGQAFRWEPRWCR